MNDRASSRPEEQEPTIPQLFSELFDLATRASERITDNHIAEQRRRILASAWPNSSSPDNKSHNLQQAGQGELDTAQLIRRDIPVFDDLALGDAMSISDVQQINYAMTEVIAAANREAGEIVVEARRRAERIFAGAEKYADRALNRAAQIVSDARGEAAEFAAFARIISTANPNRNTEAAAQPAKSDLGDRQRFHVGGRRPGRHRVVSASRHSPPSGRVGTVFGVAAVMITFLLPLLLASPARPGNIPSASAEGKSSPSATVAASSPPSALTPGKGSPPSRAPASLPPTNLPATPRESTEVAPSPPTEALSTNSNPPSEYRLNQLSIIDEEGKFYWDADRLFVELTSSSCSAQQTFALPRVSPNRFKADLADDVLSARGATVDILADGKVLIANLHPGPQTSIDLHLGTAASLTLRAHLVIASPELEEGICPFILGISRVSWHKPVVVPEP